MEVSNNKFSGRIVLIFAFFLAFSTNVIAQEAERELAFFEKLKEQEVKEHQELLGKIKGMDDQGYRKMLGDRINDSYKQKKGEVSGFVIVDVTEEMNQPEPGFLAKIFSSPPVEEKYGINRVEAILSSSGKGNGRKLKYNKKFSSSDKQKHFQWVEGYFSRGDAMSLATKWQIVDLHVTAPKYPTWSSAIAVDSSTGRVLPPRAQKEYSDEFLDAGLYADLMRRFETQETTIVEVNFHDYEEAKTREEAKAREQLVDDFLSQWQDYEFTVELKRGGYVFLETNKAHVEAMKAHELVSFIRTGEGINLQSVRP